MSKDVDITVIYEHEGTIEDLQNFFLILTRQYIQSDIAEMPSRESNKEATQ